MLFRSWSLAGRAELLLVPWHEASSHEQVHASEGRRLVRELAHDPLGASTLAELLHELDGPRDMLGAHDLERAALDALERGALRVVRPRPRPAAVAAAPHAAAATAAVEPSLPARSPARPHWIEIELVDDEGRPVPYARFELVSESGRRHAGILDERGFARVEPLDDAAYDIRFPHLPADRWAAA